MKSIFIKLITFSIISFILSTQVVISQNLEDNLLIHYKFDGDSLDSSGNDFNPILFRASYAPDHDGNENSALYFNGIDDLILLPDTTALKPNFPLTISFWIKMDTLIPQKNVFFTNDFDRYTHSGAWLNLSSEQRLAVSYGDGGGFYPYTRRTKLSNVTLDADIWYFITGVLWSYDDIRLYINGQEDVGYYEGTAENMVYVGTGGNIGRKDANYQIEPFFFQGYMDDFRYWDRGLSNEEVKDLYDTETVGINNEYISTEYIYPNPSSNKITISIDNEIKNYQIDILNILGEKILSVENINTIDVSDFSNGIYLLRIVNNETKEVISSKFIKH